MKPVKSQFTSRKFKGGAYATLVSVILIAVLLVINLVVGEYDVSVDMTSDSKYSLLDSTKEYLSSIDDDITIYYLIEDGSSFSYYDIDLFKENFNAVTDNIQIVDKDPVKYPKFAAGYTDEEVSSYSFIVVDNTNGRSRYVDVYDYIESEFSYSSYSYEVTGIDLEGQLVSAIQYVTTEDLPLMYVLKGHDESDVSTTLASGIAKENVDTEDLTLLTEGEIPEDCDILFIYQPQKDLTDDELDIIEEYIADGGDVLMIADIYTPDLANFSRLLSYYGIELTEGYVIEGDSQHYLMRTPYEVVPDLGSSDITSGLSSTDYVLMPYATGMMISDDIRSTITVTPILTTSSKAYAKKTLDISTYEKEDTDYEGPFYLGLECSETYDGITGSIIVYSCLYFCDDNLMSGTYANGDVFYNTLNYLADIETSVSIRSVSLDTEYVTVTAAQSAVYAAAYIVVFPLLIIIAGVIVVIRRRRL